MLDPKLMSLLFFFSSIYLLTDVGVVHCSHAHAHHHHHNHRHGPKMMFVFGDSYADTGNDRNPDASSWMEPYGVTFPGTPSGRFSDGRVFTDFLAKSLRMKSPIPYVWRKHRSSHMKYGMNFAFGGTGVFDTSAPYPNMTTQIDIFQDLLSQGVFTSQDLQHSLAHVSLVGNDYSNYLANGGTVQGLLTFIPQVVSQLVLNLQRIYTMGAKKVSVTLLQPLGCLPQNTYPTQFQECNAEFNKLTQFHNQLLQEAILKLNDQSSESTSYPFITLDLYKAFSSIVQAPQVEQRNAIFDELLVPCCTGLNSTYSCGSLDVKGNKMYTMCSNPKSYFFWDSLHPTQAGWEAVTRSLRSSIKQLLVHR